MKTRFIAVLLLVCGQTLLASTEDSYLYWMISSDATLTSVQGVDTKVSAAQYYARVGYTSSDARNVYSQGLEGYLLLYAEPGDTTSIQDYTGTGAGDISNISNKNKEDIAGIQTTPVFAYLPGVSENNYTYWVELLNEAGSVAGYQSIGTYEKLSSYVSSLKGMAIPSIALSVGAFMAPEPSSGLLLLLGVAGLALRRRKLQRKA